MSSPEKQLTANLQPEQSGNLLDVNEKLHGLAGRLKDKKPEDVLEALRLVNQYAKALDVERDMTLVEFNGEKIHQFELEALNDIVREINEQYAKRRIKDTDFDKSDFSINEMNSRRISISDGRVFYLLLSDLELTEIPKSVNKMIFLTGLALERNNIRDIENLENLVDLDRLILDDNNISEIKNLENLVALSRLLLNKNQISEISNLDAQRVLKYLYLRKNPIDKSAQSHQISKLTGKGVNVFVS